jgi:hypothetical protein
MLKILVIIEYYFINNLINKSLTKIFLKLLGIDFEEDFFDFININKFNVEEPSSARESEQNLNFSSAHLMILIFIFIFLLFIVIIIISIWLIISKHQVAQAQPIFDTNAVLVNTYRMVSQFYAFLVLSYCYYYYFLYLINK